MQLIQRYRLAVASEIPVAPINVDHVTVALYRDANGYFVDAVELGACGQGDSIENALGRMVKSAGYRHFKVTHVL